MYNVRQSKGNAITDQNLEQNGSEVSLKALGDFQWGNYVRRGEAAALGRQAAGGATEFNQNDLYKCCLISIDITGGDLRGLGDGPTKM